MASPPEDWHYLGLLDIRQTALYKSLPRPVGKSYLNLNQLRNLYDALRSNGQTLSDDSEEELVPTLEIQREAEESSLEPTLKVVKRPFSGSTSFSGQLQKKLRAFRYPSILLKGSAICFHRETKDQWFRTEYCVPRECLEDWLVQQKLGEGKFGSVYQVCAKGFINEPCPFIVKVIPIRDSDQAFLKEVELSRLLGGKGISRAFRTAFICSQTEGGHGRLGFIVLQRYDISLLELLNERLDEIDKRNVTRLLSDKVADLHRLGYVHHDIHQGNVMVNINTQGQPRDVVLIDFGRAKESQDPKDIQIDQQQLENLIHIIADV